MKRINISTIIGLGLLVVVGIGFYSASGTQEVYNAPKATTTVEIVEPEEQKQVDAIEKARAELEKVNQELDAEEMSLVEQNKQLQAQIDANNERIDSINELRTSF